MSILKSYWLAFKNGEDFSVYTGEQLGQIRIFNTVGVFLNFILGLYFEWLPFEIIFYLVMTFYIYRFWMFEKYLNQKGIVLSVRKKKD